MNIDQIRKNWTALGEEDPMWAVLTDPDKKGNRWNEEEFFASGREAVASDLKTLQDRGVAIHFGKALDFGCGLGRLSQALALHFEHVTGVDVSSSMIEKARAMNKHGAKVQYELNTKSDLGDFASEQFDFVYSLICLQHIPPQFQIRYVRDFVRLLKPGGFAYFQLIHANGWRKYVPHALVDLYRQARSGGRPVMCMYGLDETSVRQEIKSAGGSIVRQDTTPYGDWESRYRSSIYLITKA